MPLYFLVTFERAAVSITESGDSRIQRAVSLIQGNHVGIPLYQPG